MEGMKLSGMAETGGAQDSFAAESAEVEGASCSICFSAEGEAFNEKTHEFKMGQCVSEVKLFLQVTYGIQYSRQTLNFGGVPMADPLSLNDLPISQDGVNAVIVELGPAAEGDDAGAGGQEVIPPSTVEWPTDSDEED